MNPCGIGCKRYLNREIPKYKRMMPTISNAFRGLRDKIKVWYSYFIHSQFDLETKKKGWINTVEHFIGYHFDCIPHEPTKYVWVVGLNFAEAAVQLFIIIEQRSRDFEFADYRANTHKNESFNQVQLRYGPKNIRFPRSQSIRNNLAVLRYNEGISYEIELRRRLQLEPLNWKNQLLIEKMNEDREKKLKFEKHQNLGVKNFYKKIESSKK